MRKRGKIAWGLAGLFFTACSQAAPDCADEQAVNTVIQIVEEKIGQEAMKGISLKLTNIRTTDFNERIGKYSCAADLEITGPGGAKRLPIQYTSKLADGGKRFYVTVYGL